MRLLQIFISTLLALISALFLLIAVGLFMSILSSDGAVTSIFLIFLILLGAVLYVLGRLRSKIKDSEYTRKILPTIRTKSDLANLNRRILSKKIKLRIKNNFDHGSLRQFSYRISPRICLAKVISADTNQLISYYILYTASFTSNKKNEKLNVPYTFRIKFSQGVTPSSEYTLKLNEQQIKFNSEQTRKASSTSTGSRSSSRLRTSKISSYGTSTSKRRTEYTPAEYTYYLELNIPIEDAIVQDMANASSINMAVLGEWDLITIREAQQSENQPWLRILQIVEPSHFS
jgi:hypothetical protein